MHCLRLYVVVGMRDRLPSLMLRCAHEGRFTAGSRMCRAQVLARSRRWLDRVRAAWAWVSAVAFRVDRVFRCSTLVVAGLEKLFSDNFVGAGVAVWRQGPEQR